MLHIKAYQIGNLLLKAKTVQLEYANNNNNALGQVVGVIHFAFVCLNEWIVSIEMKIEMLLRLFTAAIKEGKSNLTFLFPMKK